jgi:hypothetical protein
MPSHLHESLLLLFRNKPTLAPELLRDALHLQATMLGASIDELDAIGERLLSARTLDEALSG